MSTLPRHLRTALGNHPHLDPLRDGSVKAEAVEFDHVEVTPITAIFRRMCRDLEFDVCEMSLCTYFLARAHGKPFTALPAFPLARFQHGGAVYNTDAGIDTPKDLEGRKVGLRAYSVTPGVWMRGILAQEHGVDWRKVTWVLNDEEHVAEYNDLTPPNVVRELGADLALRLSEGKLAACAGIRAEGPNIKPLIADPQEAAREFYRRTGILPLDHLVVVKDSLLAENPGLGQALYDAFKAAKAVTLQKTPDLKIGGAGIIDGDPLPYGIEPNRRSMQMLIDLSVEQKVLSEPLDIDGLFYPGLE